MKMLQCENFNMCGGCSLLNVSYEKQLALKQQEVQNAVKEFGLNFKVEKTVGMFFPV